MLIYVIIFFYFNPSVMYFYLHFQIIFLTAIQVALLPGVVLVTVRAGLTDARYLALSLCRTLAG